MPSERQKRALTAPVRAIDPGGRFAIALDGASWLVWDILAHRPARVGALDALPPGPLAVALAPDGRTLLVGGADGTVTAFELATGRARWTVRAHRGPVVAVAADGDRVTSVAADGTVWANGRAAEPGRAGAVLRAVGVGLAAVASAAAVAGWLPAVALAAVPALLGFRARRLRVRLSVSGSVRGVTRG